MNNKRNVKIYTFRDEFSDVEPEVLLDVIYNIKISTPKGQDLMLYIFEKLSERKHPQFVEL